MITLEFGAKLVPEMLTEVSKGPEVGLSSMLPAELPVPPLGGGFCITVTVFDVVTVIQTLLLVRTKIIVVQMIFGVYVDLAIYFRT